MLDLRNCSKVRTANMAKLLAKGMYPVVASPTATHHIALSDAAVKMAVREGFREDIRLDGIGQIGVQYYHMGMGLA